jgi:D-alanyl-lipoteichoic acid acyltransferase DltB (MBOAT superfamily)
MIFNSITYLIFLTLSVTAYWASSGQLRQLLILSFGLTFYGFWRPEFLLLMLASTLTDFIIAIWIEGSKNLLHRKVLLWTSIAINLGLLCYFKYLYFFFDSASVILTFMGREFTSPALNIILPLGISFYTFEAISYVVDVYRKFIPAERNLVSYGCFITFFPKLIAGPVLRAAELLPQFKEKLNFHANIFVSGLSRILLGLFLKVVIADNIAPFVDSGFAQPIDSLSAWDIWTLAFLFGFQIYFDFSAYSSIAIGSARLMGIQIPENFNFPYLASSPREFWQRWHISLSSWIRDYLYLPLQGVKVRDLSLGGVPIQVQEKSDGRNMYAFFALIGTWAIMGLWHGANWTLAVWGIYHACLIIGYRLIVRLGVGGKNIYSLSLGWIVTLPLVMLGWIPFRASDVGITFSMWEKVFIPKEYLWLGMRENIYLVTFILLISCLTSYAWHKFSHIFKHWGHPFSFIARVFIMTIVISMVFVFLRPLNQFIYFQF